MANNSPEWVPMALMMIAIIQAPLTVWFVYKRTRPTKGVLRGLATGGGSAVAAFLALAVAGVMATPEEERAKRNAARQEERRLEETQRLARKEQVPQRANSAAESTPTGSVVAAPAPVGSGQADQDASQWYLVAAVINEATVLGKGPKQARCQEDSGGPSAIIETAQKVDRLMAVKDLAHEGGKPVDVVVHVALHDRAGARFVRGKSRCESVVAKLNADQAAEFSSQQAKLSKYK